MAKIVLASGSPRRQELLRRIGVAEFDVRVPEVEEYFPAGLTPEETVCYISREKSQAVEAAEDEIVITADTMVFLDDKKLGKPADEAEALAMLTAPAGPPSRGVYRRDGTAGQQNADPCPTDRGVFPPCLGIRAAGVYRRGRFYGQGRSLRRAGPGALLVERIDGDFFNVMGLPVLLLSRMLAEFGIKLLG